MFNTHQNESKYVKRREITFIVLSGIFIGTLAMLNILGISRLIDLSFKIFNINIPFRVFIGVLPYPITFLCTDFISEFYGKKRASWVVWTGLILNIWVIFILWIGGILPPQPEMQPDTGLPELHDPNRVFFQIRSWTFSATLASMIAYLSAQFVDVHVFHFIKKRTKGRYLWLRNNGSTLTSQLIDSLSVVLITYYTTNAIVVENDQVTRVLVILILSNYFFKLISALVDTIPFYIGVHFLSRFLNINAKNSY